MTDLYKIGLVAQQTGISTERLRMWERRYGLQPADRAGTTRFYSTDQIRKLKLISELLVRGDAIGHIVGMNEAELQDRLAPDLPLNAQGNVDVRGNRELANPTVLFAGPGLSLLAKEHAERSVERSIKLECVEDIEEVAPDSALVHRVDVLVLEVPSLDVARVRETAGPLNLPTVVAYRNSHLHDREDAARTNLTTVRWPTGWGELESACLRAIKCGSLQMLFSKERRYSDRELVRIATLARQELDCDCVENLINTIAGLNAHEAHLSRCTEDQAHQATQSLVRDARAPLEAAVHSFVCDHGLLERVGIISLKQES